MTSTSVDSHQPINRSQVIQVCEVIDKIPSFDPKKIIQSFLESRDSNIASRRRLWTTRTGWPSTTRLMRTMKSLAQLTPSGKELWNTFILEEVRSLSRYVDLIDYSTLTGFFKRVNPSNLGRTNCDISINAKWRCTRWFILQLEIDSTQFLQQRKRGKKRL